MTDERMALVELLQKSGDGDFLRAVAKAELQILMVRWLPSGLRRLRASVQSSVIRLPSHRRSARPSRALAG
jgi:hypothetical protein